MGRVIVIGLDGGSFNLIFPLIGEGFLPNLEKIIKDGCWGDLESTPRADSFPGWTTSATGVNPGKHSIFGQIIRESNSSYHYKIPNFKDIKVKTIWEILSEKKKKQLIFNIPCSYPPVPVEGFLVAGIPLPGVDSDFTYPPGLKDKIIQAVPGFEPDSDFRIEHSIENKSKMITLFKGSLEKRKKALLYLLEQEKFDMIFSVFTEPDRVSHFFWATLDSKHPEYRKYSKKFRKDVIEFYQKLDETIGEILKLTSADDQLFIISDHGFRREYQSFDLKQWLKDKGFLVTNEERSVEQIKIIIKKLGLYKLIKKMFKSSVSGKSSLSSSLVDWRKTKIYPTPDMGIRLNLKGREEKGIVDQKEAEELKSFMEEELARLKYSNGEPIFTKILAREKIYQGPYMDMAPDFTLLSNFEGAPQKLERWRYTIFSSLTGSHSPFGIFIAKGKGIKKRIKIEGARLIDITPTILYSLNLPLTKEMDGRVLFDIFTDDYKEKRNLRIEGTSMKETQETFGFTAEEKEIIAKRLKGLGYL